MKNLWILMLLFAKVALAQQPDYTGNWDLNLEKSNLQSDKAKYITKGLFVVNQSNNKFQLTRKHYFGDKAKSMRFKMKADGKTRRIKLLFKGKLEWIENDLKATVWTKGFSNTVNYKFGDNQNEFIADEIFSSAKKSYHNVWKFDRSKVFK